MIVENVMCSVCGAICDDLIVEYDKEKTSIQVKNACRMGSAKIHEVFNKDRIKTPQIRKDGKLVDCDWDTALDKAAEILANSEYPLFFMGSEGFTEAQFVGIQMTEYLGGTVDGNATVCHGPTIMGLQEAGIVTSTLGEVKNRADLIIYWGTNPIESMPRHMSRYAVFPRGYWTKAGRRSRKIIVVDPRKTPTSNLADMHLQINPGTDYELFGALRAMLKGHPVDPSIEKKTGIGIDVLAGLLDTMKKAKFGSISVGLGIASSSGKYRTLEAAMRFVQEMNKHTKFVLDVVRGHVNVTGFSQVLAYYSGYPFSVNYSRGYPVFNPGEFTTVDMLARGEPDAVLCFAADLGAHLPRKSVEHLSKIPLITIDVARTPTTEISEVVLPGVHIIESEGTMYRLDNVPLYSRRVMESPFSFTRSDEDTLNQLFERVKRLKEKG